VLVAFEKASSVAGLIFRLTFPYYGWRHFC
jgi:hypothetical protein